ncbi:hypothetical protein DLREEDagrD3_18240 [Denitratisoma sp. agr-D3]
MNSKLSALLDGELEQDEVATLCDALRRNRELAREARAYAVIGASLRGEPAAGDLTDRIMAAIADEPTVLAPRRPLLGRWQRPLLAMAASVAGVLVVSAVVLAPQENKVGEVIPSLAQRGVPANAKTDKAPPRQLAAADMQEYLIAHQAHSLGATLGAGSQQIRTVSLVDEGAAR